MSLPVTPAHAVADLLQKVRLGEATVFDVVSETGSAGATPAHRLAIEMRRLQPEAPRPKVRAESPRRAHEFLAAESLAAYLVRYGSAETVVYADPAGEIIYAVLGEKADQGFEVVTMKPQVHPLWAPWAAILGRPIALQDFAAHVARNRRTIADPDGRELTLMLSQVRATVSVEIHSGRGANAVNGLMVTTRIQGQDKKELVELPETLRLNVPLYVQTPAEDIEIDLLIEADRDGQVTVLPVAGTLAEARVRAFERMVSLVQAGTESIKATLTFGRPRHDKWAYLREIDGGEA